MTVRATPWPSGCARNIAFAFALALAVSTATLPLAARADSPSTAPSDERTQAAWELIGRVASNSAPSAWLPSPTLEIWKPNGIPWAATAESHAYEESLPDGSSKVSIQSSWALRADTDALMFTLAHEWAHAACLHDAKLLGAYAEESKAVGASLPTLQAGLEADMAFNFATAEAKKSMEFEADRIGAIILRKADMDPVQAAAKALGGHGAGLGPHPSSAARVQAILTDRQDAPLGAALRQCQSKEFSEYDAYPH